jgi:hypothetical protein
LPRSARQRMPRGTTKYSRGYSECQRIGTGENQAGQYFATPFMTKYSRRTRGAAMLGAHYNVVIGSNAAHALEATRSRQTAAL